MDERIYQVLVKSAVILTLLWVGWTLYEQMLADSNPVSRELAAASRYIEDGQHQEALNSYQKVLNGDPDNSQALYGKALALTQLDASQPPGQANSYAADAIHAYNRLIAIEEGKPESERNRSLLGVSYANRGILKDRYGSHRQALSDYQTALRLEPKLAEGPGWMTRFLRNQAKAPSTIADRAAYLAEQLKLPASEQILRQQELDSAQRSYKM
ncbi:MAG: hypothetical protein MI754_14395 [Chromatiales bacterium]|nr:hypothetical protein [Chromatiales bacterium]